MHVPNQNAAGSRPRVGALSKTLNPQVLQKLSDLLSQLYVILHESIS